MTHPAFNRRPCTLVAAAVSLVFPQVPSWANPTGAQVVNGAVSISQPGAGILNVTNSPGSIINWQGFSIGAGEVTRFIQQSGSSAVLNRVVGSNVSQIYGQLLSNGQVFLINPAGIVVGPGAIVDTAGFVASTLNMLDSDFLAGKLKFQGDSASGSILNQGWIRTGAGGRVILVAPQIENQGLIQTPGGELLLAAGQKLTISSLDLEGVQFEVQAPTDSVINIGKLLAEGGAVGVFAGTLKHSGEIRANALTYDEAGRVVLKAQGDLQLLAGSITSADGKIGGAVTALSTAGETRVAGEVSATGSAGTGGDVRLLGNSVSIVNGALVDASGSTGGGTVRVGGDYQGANPDVQNSQNTFVGAGAALRADATSSGDGGRVIVWSDDKAQFYGALSAQGGIDGGNGGFAEVSGKGALVFAGTANLGAPKGSLGNLLLDPLDLYVFTGGGTNQTIINESTDFPSNAATVDPTTLQSIVGNVTLYASRYMRFGSDVTLTTPGQTLTAQVGTWTAPTATTDPLSLSNSNNQINTVPNRLDIGGNITTAGGAVSLSAPAIQGVATSTINTSGGAITLSATTGAIQASTLALNAGSGAVSATAATFEQLGAVTGASITTSAASSLSLGAVTSGAGAVSLTSTNSAISATSVTTSGGAVTATAGAGVSSGNIATSGGSVTLTGTNSSISTGNITAGAGNVALSGTGVSAGTIDTTGTVAMTASNGNVSATVDHASSVTASATRTLSSASVSINSNTALNATQISATASNCVSAFSCPGASVTLNAAGNVNVGTVSASAPSTTSNVATYGAAYADDRFENRSESVSITSTGGSIRALSPVSTVTASDVTLQTGVATGGGIGQAASPITVDARRAFVFRPNGEFNVALAGTGPNNIDMRVGVAPTGQTYSGTLTKTGAINIALSATDSTVTTSTFALLSGFDQRVSNGSPGFTFYVPNGSLVVPSATVPTGDLVGIASPYQRYICSITLGCTVPGVTIEPFSVAIRAFQDLTVSSYTRATGTVAKTTSFAADNGNAILGAIHASRDPVTVNAAGDISVADLTTLGSSSITSNVPFSSSAAGNIDLTSVVAATGVTVNANKGNVTVGSIDTSSNSGTGSVNINAYLGTVQAQPNVNAVEIRSGGAVNIGAARIASTAAAPLDITAPSVSLNTAVGGGGAIGSALTPVVANTTTLAVNSATNFNVDTGTTNLKNLTVTARPAGVGNAGLARVTTNGTSYDFVSDGANFTVGGGTFAAVPGAQFNGGTLSFTSTSGNITLDKLDFSAGNSNVSVSAPGNVTQMPDTVTNLGTITHPINLGSGALTVHANGNVSLQSVNAGGMTASYSDSGGCAYVGSSYTCGVQTFTANQTLTDTANAGGTWSVASRGAITTGALQVGGVSFTTASGGVITGDIGTAARPAGTVSISTTGSIGGDITTEYIEANNVTLNAQGSVWVGSDVARSINANNPGASAVSLTSQSGSVTGGAIDATSITVQAPTSIDVQNINAIATTPGAVTLVASSGSTSISTGSIDGTSIRTSGAYPGDSPGNISVNGPIGARASVKPTQVSLRGNGAMSINGAVTLDSNVAGSLDLSAGTTLTVNGALTAGDGSDISLYAGNTNTQTPFTFSSIYAGPNGTLSIYAPAGITQIYGSATAGTVTLSATGAISGAPVGFQLNDTTNLTINAGGSVAINRGGANGAPLLTDLDITRSDSSAGFSLSGFASGQNVTIQQGRSAVDVGVTNTSGTPLNFSYRNSDGAFPNIAGTGITTGGGNLVLEAYSGNITTGSVSTAGGSIDLNAGGTLNISNSVDAGAGSVSLSASTLGSGVTGNGGVISTGSVTVDSWAGIGTPGTTPIPVVITAPDVTLRAYGTGNGGNILATLNGTTDLTMTANSGFTVSSSVPLTRLDLVTPGNATGPVSLTTTNAQSFDFARDTSTSTLIVNGITSGTPLSYVNVSASNNNLTVRGAVAADDLSLRAANGTLTLDGSSSALSLSNATQDFLGNTLAIQGTVSAAATSSQTMYAYSNATFTGTGTLSSGGYQGIQAGGGNLTFTSQGGPINLTSSQTQYLQAWGNLAFNAQGGAIAAQAVGQTVYASGPNSTLTLQGGAGTGQSVTLTASGTQTVQTQDNGTSAIAILGGAGADSAAKILYTGTGTQTVQGGTITMTGGSGTNASSLISTATGAQLVRANRDIKLTGGTASGADARIENTGTQQQRVGETEYYGYYYPQPYQTDNVILQGGTGAEAAITAAGLQKIEGSSSIQVLGGNGGVARISDTSTTAEQRIGCLSSFDVCYNTTSGISVIAGTGGAYAQIAAAAAQRLQAYSGLTVTGNAANGGYAAVTTTGSTQQVQAFGTSQITAGTGAGSYAQLGSAGTQALQFGTLSVAGGGSAAGNTATARISATGNQTLNYSALTVSGGAGAASFAQIDAGGTQQLSGGNITMSGGTGAGSYAEINAAGTQQLSSGNITLTAGGSAAAPLASSSAIIEGHGQIVSASAVTLNGGSGTSGNTADAVIRNLTGTQQVSASTITMNGGHTYSTTGILNQGTGTQNVSATTIAMRSDTVAAPANADASVLIQNAAAANQAISGALSLANTGNGTVAVTSAGNQQITGAVALTNSGNGSTAVTATGSQQIVANNGGVSVSTAGAGASSITGNTQLIRARYVDVSTAAGSTGNATIAATGSQWIHTTNGTASPTGNSLRVAALGSGTASVTSGTSQLLELDYPDQMQGGTGGKLMIGDVNAAGVSRVKAADQSVFARSITIQGGLANAISELKAANTQTITTLQGGIDVLGGSGANSLAQIDPTTQTILSNGNIAVVGGSGTNAIAQIVADAGTTLNGQNLTVTSGGLTLTGGTASGAAAYVTNTGSSSLVDVTGAITLTAGPVVGADAIVSVGNGPGTLTFLCGFSCLLAPVGTSPTGGILANVLPTMPSTSVQDLLVIPPVLTLLDNITNALFQATPEGAETESVFGRRAPICR